MDWKLELVPIPVSDVDRAKAFYTEKVGFSVDHDIQGQSFCANGMYMAGPGASSAAFERVSPTTPTISTHGPDAPTKLTRVPTGSRSGHNLRASDSFSSLVAFQRDLAEPDVGPCERRRKR